MLTSYKSPSVRESSSSTEVFLYTRVRMNWENGSQSNFLAKNFFM